MFFLVFFGPVLILRSVEATPSRLKRIMNALLQQFNVSGIQVAASSFPESCGALDDGDCLPPDCSSPVNNCDGGFGGGDCDVDDDGGE